MPARHRPKTAVPAVAVVERRVFHHRLLPCLAAIGTLVASTADVLLAQECIPPPSDMVAWWAADDCGPSDLLGHHDGTFEGDWICHIDWKVGGGAMYFEPDPPTYVWVPDADALDFGAGALSIDAWIRTDVDVGIAPIINKWEGPSLGYYLYLSGGLLEFQLCTTEFCYLFDSSGPAVANGAWHHVAVTVDPVADVVNLYVDGGLAADGAHTEAGLAGSSSNDAVLRMGAEPVADPPLICFNGLVDELEIFDRALTAQEIQAVFEADSAGKCKCVEPPSDMLAWWPLDETAGLMAFDIAGTHDAHYVGNPTPRPDGKVAGALTFGPEDSAQTSGLPFNLGESDFSIDAWVLVESAGVVETWIVDRGHDCHFAANSGTGEPHLICGCLFEWWPDPIPMDTWTHLAVTVEWNNAVDGVKMYLNGDLVGTDGSCAYNIDYADVPFRIGGRHAAAARQEALDEVEVFDRVLDPDEILAIYEAGSAGKCKPVCVDPPPDMLAWWTGDDCGPSDLLGRHHGTFHGFPVCPQQWWVGGGAMAFFPGTYISVPHDDELNPGAGELSIDAWIITDADGIRPIVDKGSGAAGSYGLQLVDGQLNFWACDHDVCAEVSTTETVNDNMWHHVAGVFRRHADPHRLVVYIDGEARATNPVGAFGMVDPPDDLLIGAGWVSGGDPTSFFDGVMDEIEIFNRALDPEEIEGIYLAGRAGKCRSEPIPTASEWGVLIMTLLIVTAGTLVLPRRAATAGKNAET